jgi:small subunit ribosomal protein S2
VGIGAQSTRKGKWHNPGIGQNMIDFKQLIKAGVHFGHQKTRWCPKMAPYIWGYQNNVHLIDVSKTAARLEEAAQFLQKIAADGKVILFVGTKKAARESIVTAATSLGMPFVYHRWIGGTLSNNSQVKKSVTKLLHYQDILAKSDKNPHYTKKEYTVFRKLVERLEKNVGGIKNLTWPVGAVVLVDVTKERSALKEASIMGIPVVGIVDTNSDPSMVDYVVPANDDSPRSINLLVEYLADAIRKGVAIAQDKTAKEKEERLVAAKAKKDVGAPAAKKAIAKDKKEAVKEQVTAQEQPQEQLEALTVEENDNN